MQRDFSNVGNAMLIAVYRLLWFLFVWPLDMWLKAVNRIVETDTKDAFDVSKINSRWPFLVLIKRFSFDFAFDALAVIWYPIGAVLSVIAFIKGWSDISFGVGASAFFSTLVVTYYSSVYLCMLRDFAQLMFVAPIRKFISWLDRPAQYLEIDNKVQNKN